MTPELRELLELSAQAMGYKILNPVPEYLRILQESPEDAVCELPDGHVFVFDPSRDKAQCFDMECELKISVEWTVDGVDAVAMDEPEDQYIIRRAPFSDHDNDRAATRMMASLRVAAEIGRRMQNA